MFRPLSLVAALLFYAPALADAQNPAAANPSPANPEAPPAAAAAAPQDAARSAGRTLDEARVRINRLRTAAADLRMTAVVDGHRFVTEGRLLLASGGRVRLELNPTAEQEGVGPALLQVNNGIVMNTRYAVGDRVAVTRRNVRTVREAAAERPSGAGLAGDLASGGLAGALASLRTAMRWEEPETATISDRSYVVLTGRWTADAREALDVRPDALKPDGVTVHLDAERLFPQRIRYWTQEPGGPRVPTLTLTISEVVLNGALPADAFDFPLTDGIEVDDQTERAVTRARTAGTPLAAKPQDPEELEEE